MPDSPLILALDLGTSSVRTLLFDARTNVVNSMEARRAHVFEIGQDGAVEADADELLRLLCECIDETLARAGKDAANIGGVAALLCSVMQRMQRCNPSPKVRAWQSKMACAWPKPSTNSPATYRPHSGDTRLCGEQGLHGYSLNPAVFGRPITATASKPTCDSTLSPAGHRRLTWIA